MASTPLDPIAKTANLVTTEGKHNLRRSRSQFTVENPWKRRLDDDDLPSVANKGNVSSGRDQAAINRRHAAAKKEAISDLKTSLNKMKSENKSVVAENLLLKKKIEALQLECAQHKATSEDWQKKMIATEKKIQVQQLKGSDYEWAVALKRKGFPAIKKEAIGADLTLMVSNALLALMAVVMAYTKPINRLRILVKVLFQNFIFGVDATSSVLSSLVRKFVRSSVFVPWKILKAMDLAPKGSLNYRGIETLRQVEGLSPWEQGLLPSRSTIQSQAKKMYVKGQQVIPIKAVDCPLGEMFQFDYERKLRLILKTFGLDGIAQTSNVEISITLDGAELCDFKSHLTAGVKVTDKRAIDPRTKLPLCSATGM